MPFKVAHLCIYPKIQKGYEYPLTKPLKSKHDYFSILQPFLKYSDTEFRIVKEEEGYVIYTRGNLIEREKK